VQKPFSVLILGLASMLGCTLESFAAGVETAGEVVPFKLQRGHLIAVRCSVGGIKNLIGIIDTGASETVLDITLVRKLSLATKADRATFITQKVEVWEVAIPGLQVGPITVDRLEGIATDLSSLTAELGIRPQVLIGMDLLHRTSFAIDYRSRRLVFGPAPLLAHNAPLVPMASEDPPWRFVLIESRIGGQKVRLQVDSGFDGLLLYRDRLSRQIRDEGATRAAWARSESQVAHLGQSLMASNFDAPSVKIGDWQAPHNQLVVDGPPPGSTPFDGLIGTAFLSQRRIAFDFENGMLYWE